MSRVKRLGLDQVISSVPELGPTVTNGGYSWWIILIGTTLVQMTVSGIVPMYGVILGYLSSEFDLKLDSSQMQIVLTPILFAAFFNLSDPYTRIIINLASSPRIMGLIGVCLVSTGVLASGYLATGGVGAYLANLSAGGVMGIGGSFILNQTECVLRRNFRTRLRFVLLLKEISMSLGFILAPGFVLKLPLKSNLHFGLLLMASYFIPTAIGVLLFRYFTLTSHASPYTLLISDDENELMTRVTSNSTNSVEKINDNFGDAGRNEVNSYRLFGEGSENFNYQDLDDDEDLFSVNPYQINNSETLKEKLRIIRSISFWIAAVVWIGCKSSALFILILLPSIMISTLPNTEFSQAAILPVIIGVGSLIPIIFSYWRPCTAPWRSFCFGGASWLGSLVLLGLLINMNLWAFFILAFIGGISIGGAAVYLEFAIVDILGCQSARKALPLLSTAAGLYILSFTFIHSPQFYLQLNAAIQLIGGLVAGRWFSFFR